MVQPVTIGNATLFNDDCINVLRSLPANSIEACLTDPPYGLSAHSEADIRKCMAAWLADEPYTHGKSGFMGKNWDSFVPGPEMWRELYRVLKPGAHLLVFAGTRTADLMSLALRLAGFECRDSLQWVFGCLDESTEIATKDGIKPYHKTEIGNPVLCYNPVNAEYSYQPIQEIFEYDYDDTAYRLVGDFGEQVVSRSHRILIERDGKEVFITAEEAAAEKCEISVPVLEDLPALREALYCERPLSGGEKSCLQQGLYESTDLQGAFREKEADGVADGEQDELPCLRKGVFQTGLLDQESEHSCMQQALQRVLSRRGMEETRTQGSGCMDGGNTTVSQRENDWREKSCMERRSNVPEPSGELCQSVHQVCSLPTEIYRYGEERRVCNGISVEGSDSDRSPIGESGGGTPYQSSGDGQPARKPDAVQDERGSQSLRGWRGHKAAVVRILPFRYTGKVWCIRVPTGCFVAVRNGVAFPTGNSGFPKASDIGKQIDATAGRIDCATKSIKQVIKDAHIKSGKTLAHLNQQCGFEASGYLRESSTWATVLPSKEKWAVMRDVLGLSSEMDALFQAAEREIIGFQSRGISVHTSFMSGGNNITAPATPEAAQWDGWKSSIKPAYEPILLFRKPLDGTIAGNTLKWGTGGLNVDACRVGYASEADKGDPLRFTKSARSVDRSFGKGGSAGDKGMFDPGRPGLPIDHSQGRYPANIILDSSEEVEKCFPVTGPSKAAARGGTNPNPMDWGNSRADGDIVKGHNDSGGSASRFFQHCDYTIDEIAELNGIEPKRIVYSGKASRRDRNDGCEGLEARKVLIGAAGHKENPMTGKEVVDIPRQNFHPTTKPTQLLRYLLRLVTPPGATVIDPFLGSGSTAKAALLEGFNVIGIEREPDYFEICKARTQHAANSAPDTKPSRKAAPAPSQQQRPLFEATA
jgi:DNA modification methylase